MLYYLGSPHRALQQWKYRSPLLFPLHHLWNVVVIAPMLSLFWLFPRNLVCCWLPSVPSCVEHVGPPRRALVTFSMHITAIQHYVYLSNTLSLFRVLPNGQHNNVVAIHDLTLAQQPNFMGRQLSCSISFLKWGTLPGAYTTYNYHRGKSSENHNRQRKLAWFKSSLRPHHSINIAMMLDRIPRRLPTEQANCTVLGPMPQQGYLPDL